MRIGWAHDNPDGSGGAELTNATLAEAAPAGMRIVPCSPGNVSEADCYILHNVKEFSQPELEEMTAVPYIKFEHDHWNCIQPWQLACVKPVMEGAAAVVFLSPLHRDTFIEEHDLSLDNVYCVPSPVDPSKFHAAEGKEGTVWLGAFWQHKGVRDACRWASKHQEWVTFYGWGPFRPAGPYVRVGGYVRYEHIPAILAKAARFLYLPLWVEAFGRTVAEAVLSDCELVCNENVGALSWGWDGRQEWAENLATAPVDFWRIVMGVL